MGRSFAPNPCRALWSQFGCPDRGFTDAARSPTVEEGAWTLTRSLTGYGKTFARRPARELTGFAPGLEPPRACLLVLPPCHIGRISFVSAVTNRDERAQPMDEHDRPDWQFGARRHEGGTTMRARWSGILACRRHAHPRGARGRVVGASPAKPDPRVLFPAAQGRGPGSRRPRPRSGEIRRSHTL